MMMTGDMQTNLKSGPIRAALSDLNQALAAFESSQDHCALFSQLQAIQRSYGGNWKMRGQQATSEAILGFLSENPSKLVFVCPLAQISSLRVHLATNPPKTWKGFSEALLMLVRRMQEVTSERECPACRDSELACMIDTKSNAIVLQCGDCGWAETVAARPWVGTSTLRPASLDDLPRISHLLLRK